MELKRTIHRRNQYLLLVVAPTLASVQRQRCVVAKQPCCQAEGFDDAP